MCLIRVIKHILSIKMDKFTFAKSAAPSGGISDFTKSGFSPHSFDPKVNNSPKFNINGNKIPSLTLPKFARAKSTSQSPHNLVTNKSDIVPIVSSVTPTPLTIRTPAAGIVNGIIPTTTHTTNVIPNTAPKTPLYIPRIGIPKEDKNIETLQPDENPWLPPKVEGYNDVKIAALTPIGTIALVPTCDKRPVTPRKLPPTPGRLPSTPGRLPPTPVRNLTLRVIDENTGTTRIDPIMTATIYLDCTKSEDRSYNHVAERMRKITENTTTLQKQYSTTFRPLANITGKVSHSLFEEALLIYENNQVYYQDRIDDKTLSQSDIQSGLTSLEHWFASIIEPKNYDDATSWKERELFKLRHGITSYCDPELYKYIQPLPSNLLSLIKQYQIDLL